MKCYVPNFFVVLFLLTIHPYLSAQIIGQLTYETEAETYLLSVIPKKTIVSPRNITNTGQFTLKAPTNSFDLTDFQSITGNWQFSQIIKSPTEAKNSDYLVFNLITPLTNPAYVENEVLPLFSFKNKLGCSEKIVLVENLEDAFWPPNSQSANIGNQLTVLEYGITNAYSGNESPPIAIQCPSKLAYELRIDSIKCAGEAGQLLLEVVDAYFPFNYEIWQKDKMVANGTLTAEARKAEMVLSEGQFQIIGFDQKDTALNNIELLSPTPLTMNVVQQENIPCQPDKSATVILEGNGGNASNYQFNWSHGVTGAQIDILEVGNYTVTLTDANNCQVAETLAISANRFPTIDSIQHTMPSCYDFEDGIIEIFNQKEGEGPYQYSMDGVNYQDKPYFTGLKAGEYQIRVKNAKNCVTSSRINLANPPLLTIQDIETDGLPIRGTSIELRPIVTYSKDYFYNWTPTEGLSCTDCPNPTLQLTENKQLTLTIQDSNGCEASFSKLIAIKSQIPIFIPNSFSPNQDGQNDYFEIFLGPTVSHVASLQIYNRWGQLLFSQKNSIQSTSITWDGTYLNQPVGSGIYIYVATIQLENGDVEVRKGDFFVLK